MSDNLSSTSTNLSGKPNSIELNGGVKCYKCSEIFLKINSFAEHFSSNHSCDAIQYQCAKCSQISKTHSAFRGHCYRHVLKDNSLRCQLCGKQYKEAQGLALHISLVHTANENSQKEILCQICKLKFDTEQDLINHNETHVRPEVYLCPICPKVYTEKGFLSRHLPFHFDNRLYKCNTCQKSFKTPKCLQNHVVIHNGKEFKCNICEKNLSSTAKLKQHMFIHTGNRPYVCKHCPKSFRNFSNWQKHSRKVHSCDWSAEKIASERNIETVLLKCHICREHFKNHHTLSVHIKMRHPTTLKNPLICEICDLKLSNKREKKEHDFLHAEKKYYQCHICHNTFGTPYNLRRHLRNVHKTITHVSDIKPIGRNNTNYESSQSYISVDSTTDTSYTTLSMVSKPCNLNESILEDAEGDFITKEATQTGHRTDTNRELENSSPLKLPKEYGPELLKSYVFDNNLTDSSLAHIDPLLTLVGNNDIILNDEFLSGNISEPRQQYILSNFL